MRSLLLLILAGCLAQSASAVVVINVTEGPGVVNFSGSGSLNLAGAGGGTTFIHAGPADINPSTGYYATNADYGLFNITLYTLTSTDTFGGGGLTTFGSPTGDAFGLSSSVAVPLGYVSLAPLSFGSTFTGTFATLGILPGTYTWTLPSDTITMNVIGAPPVIPEPSTYIAIAGFAGLGLLVWRRRKVAA